MTLQEGQHAPDFDIETTDGHRTLRELLREGALILVFYGDDDSDESIGMLGLFAAQHESLSNFSAVILGVGSDDLKTHLGLVTNAFLPYPLGADTKRELAQKYEAVDDQGKDRRLVYVIGEDGRVAGSIDPWDASNFSRIFDALGLG